MADIPTMQKHTLEVVQTGSLFQLFSQGKTRKRFTDIVKTYIYDRVILLDTDGLLPELPMKLFTGATHASSINALSPYTDDGYRFTGREIDPEQRAQILDNLDREKEIDYAAAPLCLDASTNTEVLRSMKLTEQTQTLPDPLLPEVKETLSLLRFQVALPRRDTLDVEHPIYETFVSRPDETALSLGELSFRRFTPKDSLSDKGYFLMLPSEDTIIRKLQGQFLMLPPGTVGK